MTNKNVFEVIIIGGSYAGLSAALALGRALRNVLIIDSGKPCNRQMPHSHNFLTQDGNTPREISILARQQVEKYPTIQFVDGLATRATRVNDGFEIKTQTGDTFTARKLVFATGVKDLLPSLPGFSECWGISLIHCPYCHGYEVRNVVTGILANGEFAFEYTQMISNWTKDLTLFTNGKSELTEEQSVKLRNKQIRIIETQITQLGHTNGFIENIVFSDGTKFPLTALYSKMPFEQHCDLPGQLGCAMTDQNHIVIDAFQKTNVPGVFACGDNATYMRTLSTAVAMGTLAGVAANKELITENF